MKFLNRVLVIISLLAITASHAHDLKVTIKNNEHVRVKGRLRLLDSDEDMKYNAQFILAAGDQELSTLEKVEIGDELIIDIGGIEYYHKVSTYSPLSYTFSYKNGLKLSPAPSKR